VVTAANIAADDLPRVVLGDAMFRGNCRRQPAVTIECGSDRNDIFL